MGAFAERGEPGYVKLSKADEKARVRKAKEAAAAAQQRSIVWQQMSKTL
ncbi:MAG: hypothetical protein ACPIOQ_80065 [Promethearchaeia archaeon]